MPSLQAAHRQNCALGRRWSTFEDAKPDGACTCTPTYYIVTRAGSKANREAVGKNRQKAERALARAEDQLEEGTYQSYKNIKFAAWKDKWIDAIEVSKSTRKGYRAVVECAATVFGHKLVRRLEVSDVADFNVYMRDTLHLAPSTRASYLRTLQTCLASAVKHGYAPKNVAKILPKNEKPRPVKREAAYFENAELPQLLDAVPTLFFRVLFKLALMTGMRQGELIALAWSDIDLENGVITVRKNYATRELKDPKSHHRRSVDLTLDAVALLQEWHTASAAAGFVVVDGRPLVFPGERYRWAGVSGYLTAGLILKRELYPAMERAGIHRVGATGEKRVFHSFRHTFAKRALESGAHITWLSRHLGHSTINVTVDIYGHWEHAERKAQIALLNGAFGV